MIQPGATLGVLGGGQLARMFTVAARTMGYKVVVLDPDPMCPAAAIADTHLQRGYTDRDALAYLAAHCEAVTTEFENVPVETLRSLEARCPVRPSAAAVECAQNRILEKTFIRDCGLATAPFHPVHDDKELDNALAAVRMPAVLKTAALGYDGKGQRTVYDAAQAHKAFAEFGGAACVLEQRIHLHMELSVLLARGSRGELAYYPVSENVHEDGILHTSIVPARISLVITERVTAMARTLAERLDYCGVMAVEFFLTRDHELLINEIAPRPHNTGHYSLDACATSQFEQQVRMLCGSPPGDTGLLSPVVMINLMGDLWQPHTPDWSEVFAYPNAKLHLYGKHEPRPGRKMGHCNVLDANVERALATVGHIHRALRRGTDRPVTSTTAGR